jgi:hypothetical protein
MEQNEVDAEVLIGNTNKLIPWSRMRLMQKS